MKACETVVLTVEGYHVDRKSEKIEREKNIYIYIYIYRERERERERKKEKLENFILQGL